MARILTRVIGGSGERDPNFRASGDSADGDGIASGFDDGARTGEPDPDDIGSTGDDNPSGGRVNGNGPQFTDPASGTRRSSSEPDAGGPTRRRGRPAGSRNGKRASATQTTGDIALILHSLHMGMANAFKNELFAISKDEAEKLSAAITRVTELYEIRILPEKQMAWLNLAIVGGSIYGPRIMANSVIKARKKKGVDEPLSGSVIHAVTMPKGETNA